MDTLAYTFAGVLVTLLSCAAVLIYRAHQLATPAFRPIRPMRQLGHEQHVITLDEFGRDVPHTVIYYLIDEEDVGLARAHYRAHNHACYTFQPADVGRMIVNYRCPRRTHWAFVDPTKF